VGCDAMQIFAKSPRQWLGKPIDAGNARRFVHEAHDAGNSKIFTHTAYLINLAAPDDVLWERSIDALADEITRGRVLGADGVVTHLGTHPTGESDEATARIAAALDEAFYRAGGPADSTTRLLLENTAGAGNLYGRSIEAIGRLMRACENQHSHLGVCFDTCHGHASGIDVSTDGAWDALLSEVDAQCGRGAIKLIHANDCMFEFGSRRDRHAWIGEGTIGIEGFAAMMRREELAGVSVITEMPGEVPEKDEVNIALLKALRMGQV
ncbi:MAG: deoxyribonuclease IV, partial [Coriobacteriia bacterium]|nr:deoxyribonuclease IV [Coriobacteriia bacterium]